MDEESVISILFLGDSNVGKSTFLSRLTRGKTSPPNEPLPVLQDLDQPFIFEIRARRQEYRFELYDTASPENYTLLRPKVIILCYAINDRDTLQNVQQRWKYLVETHFNYDEAIPVMLLGLKRDLRRENDPQVVFPQEAVRVAAEMRCDRYAEVSAVTGELCAEAFEDIATMAVGTTLASGGKTPGARCVIL